MTDFRELASEARREREAVLVVMRDTTLPRAAREAGHRSERNYARMARVADKLADDADLLARLVREEE